MTPVFLPIELVLYIHSDQINLYGGMHGVRDESLLDSALAQPEATYGGKFLHRDIPSMAAAYAFHISQNQPFYDGNKRAAGMCMMTFLALNNYETTATDAEYFDVIMRLAQGMITKAGLTKWIRKHSRANV